jgi:hypothetical protein
LKQIIMLTVQASQYHQLVLAQQQITYQIIQNPTGRDLIRLEQVIKIWVGITQELFTE